MTNLPHFILRYRGQGGADARRGRQLCWIDGDLGQCQACDRVTPSHLRHALDFGSRHEPHNKRKAHFSDMMNRDNALPP